MRINTGNEQPTSSNKEAKKKSLIEKILNGPVAYKVVLSSVVMGIIAVCVFWVYVTPQAGNPNSTSLTMPPDIKAYEEQKTSRLNASRKEHESIKHLLESISSRIDERASVLIENSVLVKSELQDMAESIKQINEMISELGVSHKDLSRQISESNSGLNAVAEDIQALKVAKRKSTTRQKTRSVKKPPFVIDAIDVWGNVGYVAVSQAGHVSFLKVGDQQSGWTLTDIDHLKGQVSFQGAAGNVYSTSIKR